jgi:signal transduction histidine kinase
VSRPRRNVLGKLGLARQLWLVLLVPIAAALGLYGIVSDQIRHRVFRSEASAELRNHATLVEAAVGGAVDRGEVDVLRQRIERLARADRILGIVAFEARGDAILVTGPIAEATPELSLIAHKALVGGTEIEEERELAGDPVLVRTVTFSPKSGGPAVVAVVVRDLRYLDAFAKTANQGLALTGAALLLLTGLIAELASRVTVGQPSGAIVAGVKRVARGDLETTVPEQGASELRQLARAFNAMTASLGEARSRVEQEEAARVAVERKLQHAQALAAVGQVAASMGHEIGSPLNVILGRARRLADKPDCPADIRDELEVIAVQSERISRVVARLLTVARPSQSLGDGSDVVKVVRDTLSFLGPECRHRLVDTTFEPGNGHFRAALDADHLFQIVFNLCLNAAQAQPAGGQITVSVTAVGKRKIVLDVEDRGPGVPPGLGPHIFDAFFTSKSDHGGTGLGLAIVSGIVREAGGSVELVPTSHGGACFRVHLPASDAPSPHFFAEGRA